jgi:hypothetical protein
MREEKEVWQALYGVTEKFTEIDEDRQPVTYVALNVAVYILEWVLGDRTALADGVLQYCESMEVELAMNKFREIFKK